MKDNDTVIYYLNDGGREMRQVFRSDLLKKTEDTYEIGVWNGPDKLIDLMAIPRKLILDILPLTLDYKEKHKKRKQFTPINPITGY